MSTVVTGSRLGERKHILPVRRRTQTAVLAGEFDEKPARDVLTSFLNGVPVYELIEKEEKALKRLNMPDKRKHSAPAAELSNANVALLASAPAQAQLSVPQPILGVSRSSSALQQLSGNPLNIYVAAHREAGRPAIHMATAQRSMSLTPPPPNGLPISTTSTPEPSVASSWSRASSKRPRTPDDHEDLAGQSVSTVAPRPKKPRTPRRKGWKGWAEVEGSPPPSEKLINLDRVVVLNTRRTTRSGRNFDG